jgi:hypothetical protein
MEIIVKDKETINLILDELISLKKCTNELKNIFNSVTTHVEGDINNIGNKINNNNLFITNNDTLLTDPSGNFKIINKNNKYLIIEFYETKPPHSRQIFVNQIEQLISCFDILKKININKIDPSSWFCILWSPFKSTRNTTMNCTFLSYYQFNFNTVEENNENNQNASSKRNNSNFTEIPIIGILPIKFDNKIFLARINKFFPQMQMNNNSVGLGVNQLNMNMNMNMSMNMYQQNGYFNDNHHNFLLKSSIVNKLFTYKIRTMFTIMLSKTVINRQLTMNFI